ASTTGPVAAKEAASTAHRPNAPLAPSKRKRRGTLRTDACGESQENATAVQAKMCTASSATRDSTGARLRTKKTRPAPQNTDEAAAAIIHAALLPLGWLAKSTAAITPNAMAARA